MTVLLEHSRSAYSVPGTVPNIWKNEHFALSIFKTTQCERNSYYLPVFRRGSQESGRLGNLLRATQLVRSGAGFRARQNQNLVTGLLTPVVATLLPHTTVPAVSTCRPLRRPNSKATIFISSPRFLSSLSLPHHCAFSDFHRTSPVYLPLPAHSPGPACITVTDAHILSSFLKSKLLRSKVPAFPLYGVPL